MKRVLIAASMAVMAYGSAAYAAGSSPQSNSDNPYAARNEMGNDMKGSAATQGGSMRDPGGNRAFDSNRNDPTTGVPQGTNRTGPQSGPAVDSSGSSGTAPNYGTGTRR